MSELERWEMNWASLRPVRSAEGHWTPANLAEVKIVSLNAELARLRAELAECSCALYDEQHGITATLRNDELDRLRAELATANATIAELRGALDAYRGQVDRYGRHSAADALAAAPQPQPQPAADDLARDAFPARYMASCPDGELWCNSLPLIRAVVDIMDVDEDWTITDTQACAVDAAIAADAAKGAGR